MRCRVVNTIAIVVIFSGCLPFVVGAPPLETGLGATGQVSKSPNKAVAHQSVPPTPSAEQLEHGPTWDAWVGSNLSQYWLADRPRFGDVGIGYHFRGLGGRTIAGPYMQLAITPYHFGVRSNAYMSLSIRSRTEVVVQPSLGIRQAGQIGFDLVTITKKFSNDGVMNSDGFVLASVFPGQLSVGAYLEADYTSFMEKQPGLPDHWSVSGGIVVRFPAIVALGAAALF